MKLPTLQDARVRRYGKKATGAVLTTAAILLLLGSLLVSPHEVLARDIPSLEREPESPRILQVYFNTKDKREYIYNGQEWVPHDASIDSYVLKKYKKTSTPAGNGTTASSSTTAEIR